LRWLKRITKNSDIGRQCSCLFFDAAAGMVIVFVSKSTLLHRSVAASFLLRPVKSRSRR
jgi:hypothetical protein